ncbi:MAG: DUF2460 domain-containing protein [Henriciella sp.]|nr:DUF2460 domain-containing protein [Henriciella sp.]
MTGFHEVSFPMRLALGAVGGPQRRTEIVTLASGREVRNSKWAGSRRRWDVGGAVTDLSRLQELISFFEARMGPLYGFRFRDPVDHSSAPPGTSVSSDDQFVGIGDGTRTTFQLSKDYDGVSRDIQKPVFGTTRVSVDGTELNSGWHASTERGELLFDTAPANGAIIRAGFEFECAVRFESDQINGVVEAFGAGRVVSLGLIELL